MAEILSDSLTLSSSAFAIVVVPLAKHAASDSTGSSSTPLGMMSPDISVAIKSLLSATISATG